MNKRELNKLLKELDSDLQHYVVAGNKTKADAVRSQIATLKLQLQTKRGK